MIGALCSAKLRDGAPSRSVATNGEFCAYHAALAAELGAEPVSNGSPVKRRNARERLPVIAESEPLQLNAGPQGLPSAVRPALALTAAEEVETIRRVLLEAAPARRARRGRPAPAPSAARAFARRSPSPTTAPGSRRSRPSFARVLGESEVVEPKMPSSAEEVENLSWDELNLVFAMSHASEIRAVVEHGDEALRLEVGRWEPEARAAVARALAEVA